MNQTSDPDDADREARITAFLEQTPEDMTPHELELVLLAILTAHVEDSSVGAFLHYLALRHAFFFVDTDDTAPPRLQ